jgi:hypothetical protein
LAINPAGNNQEFKVSGIFDLQVASINQTGRSWDRDAQVLFAAEDRLSAIEIQIVMFSRLTQSLTNGNHYR